MRRRLRERISVRQRIVQLNIRQLPRFRRKQPRLSLLFLAHTAHTARTPTPVCTFEVEAQAGGRQAAACSVCTTQSSMEAVLSGE
jgi:hypothetical protein